MHFLILHQLAVLNKKTKKQKSQEVPEWEAWYPRIIAMEPGNNKTLNENQYGRKVG